MVLETRISYGGLAQVVERSICIREAPGSIPGFSIFAKARQVCWKTLQRCKMHHTPFSTRLSPCIRLAFDFGKCRDPGLNQGPSDLQSDALPTELSRLCILSPRFLCHGIDYEKQFKNIRKQLHLASGSVICTT